MVAAPFRPRACCAGIQGTSGVSSGRADLSDCPDPMRSCSRASWAFTSASWACCRTTAAEAGDADRGDPEQFFHAASTPARPDRHGGRHLNPARRACPRASPPGFFDQICCSDPLPVARKGAAGPRKRVALRCALARLRPPLRGHRWRHGRRIVRSVDIIGPEPAQPRRRMDFWPVNQHQEGRIVRRG